MRNTDSLFPSSIVIKEKTQNRNLPSLTKDRFNKERDEIAASYWNKCLEIIRDNVSPQVFITWFEPMKAYKWENNILTIVAPSQFFCEWIETHFYDLMSQTSSKVLGESAKLQYIVIMDDAGESLDKRTIKVPAFRYPPSGAQTTLPFSQTAEYKQEFTSNLSPRYSFQNFITGDSNQLASSAAMAVGKDPGGTKFNPLVIYGDTGLGKTHLAQAVGNFITQKSSKARIIYTNSEHFTMEFINAVRNNKTTEFVNFYRNIDVLIVDDIQFLAGKEKTQDNFFHTFNALHSSGKQLVLTSDKPPSELADVDERLISRFKWGLTVDIKPPDLEMRMAIVQKKSMDEGIDLPGDIVEYIARNVTSSIREIEGTLISLIAKVTLDRRELSVNLAKEVIYGAKALEPRLLTMDDIKNTVAGYYKLPIEHIESKARKHEIALARQMAMYLAKQLTQLSLKSIGSHFGGRDHSTVLHSCQTIENYLVTDKTVKNAFNTLFNKLKID